MAAGLIPPMPVEVVPGSQYWNDWINQLRFLVNGLATGIKWVNIQDTPTTLAGYGITDAQGTAQKDVANGYAGLDVKTRIDKGVDSPDYIIATNAAKGLVMVSPNGHFWVAAIGNTGTVTWTDVGATSP